MNELFSRRALQNRHRGIGSNGPISLLSLPLKATLALGMAIAVGGALWATLARIPIIVQGTGVLVPVSAINNLLSASDGVVIWTFNHPVQPWHERARRFKQRPYTLTNQQMISLAEEIVAASEQAADSVGNASTTTSSSRYTKHLKDLFHGKPISAGRLLMWVQSSSQQELLTTALDRMRRTLRETSAQEVNILDNQRALKQQLSSQSAYLASMKTLESNGFVSRASILQQQSQVDNIRAQIRGNENQLIGLDSKRDQGYQQLRDALAALINDQLIYSPRNAYLSEVIPNNGSAVSRGDPLFALSDDALDGAGLVPLFLSNQEMSQVVPGMKVLATPVGFKRSEFGGIRGVVVSKAKVPSSLSDIEARVGIKALAQLIAQAEPAPVMAIVALERAQRDAPRNSGGYRWSSRGDLPFTPSPGERLDVDVITRNITPISLVLPALRSALGLTPPKAQAGASTNQAVETPQP